MLERNLAEFIAKRSVKTNLSGSYLINYKVTNALGGTAITSLSFIVTAQQNSLWPMGLGVAASREGLGVVWQRSADIVTQL